VLNKTTSFIKAARLNKKEDVYDKENDVCHGFRTCADVHLVWRSAQGSISGQGFS
jgi:hypothetical protein